MLAHIEAPENISFPGATIAAQCVAALQSGEDIVSHQLELQSILHGVHQRYAGRRGRYGKRASRGTLAWGSGLGVRR